jgi:rhamnose utilization protein RhaD (predicted bifunctional aldolase and dehydrogenase)
MSLDDLTKDDIYWGVSSSGADYDKAVKDYYEKCEKRNSRIFTIITVLYLLFEVGLVGYQFYLLSNFR